MLIIDNIRDLFNRIRKDEKGSALIETAIVIPVVLGLFMGLVFYTNAMRYKLVMNMAAKEGARTYQATHGNFNKAETRANEELALGGVGDANIEAVLNGIKVTKPYGFYIPAFDGYLINLKSEHQFFEELDPRHYKTGW